MDRLSAFGPLGKLQIIILSPLDRWVTMTEVAPVLTEQPPSAIARRIPYHKVVRDYAVIAIGATIMALGLVWFLGPYKVSAGGVSGISIVLSNTLGLPLGLTMLVLNIPLFILGIIVLGKRFGVRTFFGFTVMSVMTDLINEGIYGHLLPGRYKAYLLSDPASVNVLKDLDPLLAAIFGGVLLGFGLGLVFRAQGSTGGSDIIAQISVKYNFMTDGQTFLIFDFIVISLGAIVFNNLGYALIGFVALFVSSKTVDVVIEGIGNTKGLYIISDNWTAIRDRVLKEVERGVTIIHGEGGYTGKPKEILLVVVTRRNIYKVRQIVIDEDPKAFMIITDIHEAYGLGFKPQKEEQTPV